MPPDGEPVMTGHVTVIGAGIVGMCTASWLQQAGLDVTVLDEDEPGMRCSYGNAGGICPGSCVPLAMPGMLRKVPGWLLDPEGPLFVRMAYLPRAVPWLVRFLAAGRPDRIGEVADALRALHGPTIERYRSLVAWAGCEELLVERGQLFLYESEAELAGDALGLAIRRDRGIKADILSAAELRQLEPALDHRFTHAVYLPEQAQCLNPHRLVRALAAKFVADGGHIERTSVVSLERGRRPDLGACHGKWYAPDRYCGHGRGRVVGTTAGNGGHSRAAGGRAWLSRYDGCRSRRSAAYPVDLVAPQFCRHTARRRCAFRRYG